MNMEVHQLGMLPSSFVISGYRNPNGVISDSIQNQKKKKKQIGMLEVYIHQARNIPNICIYHKQDVYAKIYLTSDQDTKVSSRIIHGAGQEPVFDETLQMSVQTLDSSLKCEIWMLSRIKNYLQDQLLGSASVPLSDVVMGQDWKLSQEFCLSSSDVLHSQAGFVRLSLAYAGVSDILRATMPRPCQVQNPPLEDPCELDRIDFPYPKIACENEMMVSEYLKVSSYADSDAKIADTSEISLYPNEDSVSFWEEKIEVAGQAEKAMSSIPTSTIAKPIHNAKLEAKKVVQQDIVDMYMKSMQQFTESLANMKLPLQIEDGLGDSGERGSKEKVQTSKSNGQGPRVFYGSRAFF